MADFLFATDGRDRAAGALASTAASLRGLGFTRRTWYVSTNEPLNNLVVGRRVALGDDQSAEWVVFVAAGDAVTRDALHFAARAASDVDVIYGDTRHDIKREDRLPTYQRRPSFSPERLRSHNYIGELIVARRRVVDAAGGLESLVNTDAHDRNLRLCEHARRVVRLPEIFNVTPSANFLPDANPAAVERHLAR
ncbi:MAG: hypothetical protein ACKO48_00670, partial [Actinomycetota bacterium]